MKIFRVALSWDQWRATTGWHLLFHSSVMTISDTTILILKGKVGPKWEERRERVEKWIFPLQLVKPKGRAPLTNPCSISFLVKSGNYGEGQEKGGRKLKTWLFSRHKLSCILTQPEKLVKRNVSISRLEKKTDISLHACCVSVKQFPVISQSGEGTDIQMANKKWQLCSLHSGMSFHLGIIFKRSNSISIPIEPQCH